MRCFLVIIFCLASSTLHAANYTLDIINVDEVGANNRIKYAYPGIEYKVVIAAFGGTYPFEWELLQSPAGMSIDSSTGEIAWSNPSTGGTVQVKVTDAESNTDTESYTVSVTSSTDRFLFVATSDDGSPTGAIDDPYGSLDDFWGSDHGGKIVYLRSGVHEYPKTGTNDIRTINRVALESTNPLAYIGYPGETVTLDSENAGASSYCWYTSETDHYFQNIIFNDIYYYGMAIVGASTYLTVYDCTFTNTYSDDGHHNQGSINFMSGPSHTNLVIFGNIFSGHHSSGEGDNYHGIETYDVTESVIQDNEFNGTGNCGIFIKGSTSYIAIRHNVFSGPTEAWYGGVDIYGESGHHDIELSFNLFKDDESIFLRTTGGLSVAITDIKIFRNTILSSIRYRNDDANINWQDGSVEVYDNVIQNSITDSGTIPGDFNRDHFEYDDITQTEFDALTGDHIDNLVGSSGIVDSGGLLIGSYRDTYLGVVGFEAGAAPTGSAGMTMQCNWQ